MAHRQKGVRKAVAILFFLTGISLLQAIPSAFAQSSEVDVYVAQAILDYEDKKYDAALAMLREALAINPDHIEALYQMGIVLTSQEQYAQAITALDRARQLAPNDAAIAYQLGLAHFRLEQYDQAKPLFEKVFAAQPQTENLAYYLGFLRYRQKEYAGAVTAFRSGRITDPELQQLAKFYSGLALAITGLPEQAISSLEEASRIRTVSPLTGTADRLRDTIVTAQARDRRLHGELRMGGLLRHQCLDQSAGRPGHRPQLSQRCPARRSAKQKKPFTRRTAVGSRRLCLVPGSRLGIDGHRVLF